MARSARISDWIEAARPKTLPASAAPVLLGAGYAWGILGHTELGKTVLALLVALALQVGVNFANDYSDGVRGTDDARRVGPQRLTGAGLARPQTVRAAAFGAFVVAALAGIALVAWSGTWYFLLAGAAAFVAAWYYTGGRHPYGYIGGVAEVAVFVFFGLFATLGTTWTQVRALPGEEWAAAAGIGLLSCALLLVNNIRDIPGDRDAGKMTLAVRVGDRAARGLTLGCCLIAAALAIPTTPWGATAIALGGFVATLPLMRGARGLGLVAVLRSIGLLTLGYGVLLGAWAWWG